MWILFLTLYLLTRFFAIAVSTFGSAMFEIAVPVIYVQMFWLTLLPESSQTFVLFSTSFFFPFYFTLAFYKIVSAQLDSPLMWRLTFPVKEPYCCSFIPLRPPLYKTMVSIASFEHIHSSERETGWRGPLVSLPVGSHDYLFILSGSFVLQPTASSFTNIITVSGEAALDCGCTATL